MIGHSSGTKAICLHIDIKPTGPTGGSIKPQAFLSSRFMASIRPMVFHSRPNVGHQKKSLKALLWGPLCVRQKWQRNTKATTNHRRRLLYKQKYLKHLISDERLRKKKKCEKEEFHLCGSLLSISVSFCVPACVMCQSDYGTFGAVST